MNKTFTRFFAAGLAAAALASIASCNDSKSVDGADASASAPSAAPTQAYTAAPTEVPTEAPTPTPEPTPTSEPTATPVPEGWYIDPSGNIPTEVEVVSKYFQNTSMGFCIAKVNQKFMFQKWDNKVLVVEYEVPELIALFPQFTIERHPDSPYLLLGYDDNTRLGLNEDVRAFCWIGHNGETFCLNVEDYLYLGMEYLGHVFITKDRVIGFDADLVSCWQLKMEGLKFNSERRNSLVDDEGNVIIEFFDYFTPNGDTGETQPGEPIWERVF